MKRVIRIIGEKHEVIEFDEIAQLHDHMKKLGYTLEFRFSEIYERWSIQWTKEIKEDKSK